MNNLKLRAWHKQYRKMYHVACVVWDTSISAVTLQVDEASLAEYNIPDEVELMQFTGLLDRSGKEIYEGDIVVSGLGKGYVRGIVRIGRGEMDIEGYEYSYTKSYYGVSIDRLYGFMDALLDGDMYVIGNIYENEALLEWDQQLQQYKSDI
jgi:uncharacterized phage protein (TIGR01671 family)